MRGLIFTQAPGDAVVVGRTLRMFAAAGVSNVDVCLAGDLPRVLSSTTEPMWIARAGCWQREPRPLRELAPSATGRPLVGIGRGGPSWYLEPAAAHILATVLPRAASFDAALKRLRWNRALRIVPLHDIDVRFDAGLRVLQLVTTIQIGGAERVVLDLAADFHRQGTACAVAALGKPTRRAFQQPPFFADLSAAGFAPENRAEAVHRVALGFGADVIHAHLVRAREAAAIRAQGWPLAVSMHNILPSWPEGCAHASEPFADLILGCAEAVTSQLEARLPATVRTVWNGISAERVWPSGPRAAAGRDLREQRQWDPSDFVLLAVANPRPQKRLHRLPEIVASLQDLVAPRRVRLLLAGEPSAGNAEAARALAEFEHEIEAWHLRKTVYWSGAVDDVAPLLAAADAFIAVSALEGLSLAQLEALAAGIPVIATHVGGAGEVAARSPRVTLLPVDSPAQTFAEALARVAQAPPPRRMSLPAEFSRERMGARTRLALLGLALRSALPPEKCDAWLVINNLSTGGAQSSARRLLQELHQRGHSVRAATLEEWPDSPTRGTVALRSAGVPITAVAPSREVETLVEGLLHAMASARPATVVFWNVMPAVKCLLTEVLTGVRFVDVSPGEMYFSSLEQYVTSRHPGTVAAAARRFGSGSRTSS